ncbi:hypothetical protein CATMIT_01805, partial [Catenibacterium mitsuokai DSM 15897]
MRQRPDPGEEGLFFAAFDDVALVQLLQVDEVAEQAEHAIERPVLAAAAGGGEVAVGDLLAGEHAGQVRGLPLVAPHQRVVAGFDPVRQGDAQVHQRVAERGEFPVQHGADAGGLGGV